MIAFLISPTVTLKKLLSSLHGSIKKKDEMMSKLEKSDFGLRSSVRQDGFESNRALSKLIQNPKCFQSFKADLNEAQISTLLLSLMAMDAYTSVFNIMFSAIEWASFKLIPDNPSLYPIGVPYLDEQNTAVSDEMQLVADPQLSFLLGASAKQYQIKMSYLELFLKSRADADKYLHLDPTAKKVNPSVFAAVVSSANNVYRYYLGCDIVLFPKETTHFPQETSGILESEILVSRYFEKLSILI